MAWSPAKNVNNTHYLQTAFKQTAGTGARIIPSANNLDWNPNAGLTQHPDLQQLLQRTQTTAYSLESGAQIKGMKMPAVNDGFGGIFAATAETALDLARSGIDTKRPAANEPVAPQPIPAAPPPQPGGWLS